MSEFDYLIILNQITRCFAQHKEKKIKIESYNIAEITDFYQI